MRNEMYANSCQESQLWLSLWKMLSMHYGLEQPKIQTQVLVVMLSPSEPQKVQYWMDLVTSMYELTYKVIGQMEKLILLRAHWVYTMQCYTASECFLKWKKLYFAILPFLPGKA